MAAPFTREYVALSYHPQTPVTPEALHELTRVLEGYLQRIEQRVEQLQAAFMALEQRVTALE